MVRFQMCVSMKKHIVQNLYSKGKKTPQNNNSQKKTNKKNIAASTLC